MLPNITLIAAEFEKFANLPAINEGATFLTALHELSRGFTTNFKDLDAKLKGRQSRREGRQSRH
jgi:hypothetical protein